MVKTNISLLSSTFTGVAMTTKDRNTPSMANSKFKDFSKLHEDYVEFEISGIVWRQTETVYDKKRFDTVSSKESILANLATF